MAEACGLCRGAKGQLRLLRLAQHQWCPKVRQMQPMGMLQWQLCAKLSQVRSHLLRRMHHPRCDYHAPVALRDLRPRVARKLAHSLNGRLVFVLAGK